MIESTSNKQVYTVTQRENPGVFAFPVRFWNSDEIVVAIAGTTTISDVRLSGGTEFDVTGSDYAQGGTVCLHYGVGKLPALSAMIGKSVTVARELPLTQTLTLPTHGVLPSEELEGELDKIICIIQQHDEEINRCVKAPLGSGETPEELLISIYAARDASVAAKDASVVAKNGAVEAKDAAVVAKNGAVEAKDAAVVAKNGAVEAKDAAVAAAEHTEASSRVSAHNEWYGAHVKGFNHTLNVIGDIVATGSTARVIAAGGTFTDGVSIGGGLAFSGAISAAGGTFTGAISATSGTFSGAISAAGGMFSADDMALILCDTGGTFTSGPRIYFYNEETQIGEIRARQETGFSSLDLCDIANNKLFRLKSTGEIASDFTFTDCDANTQTAGDNTTKIATTAFVQAAVAAGGTSKQGRPNYNGAVGITNDYFLAQSQSGFTAYTIDFNGWIFARPIHNSNREVVIIAGTSGTFAVNFASRVTNEIWFDGLISVSVGDKLVVNNASTYSGTVTPTIYDDQADMLVHLVKIPEK